MQSTRRPATRTTTTTVARLPLPPPLLACAPRRRRRPPPPTPTHLADANAPRRRRLVAAAGSDAADTAAPSPSSSSPSFTCRRCLHRFLASDNHREACRYHPALYTGGEVAKAVGFVRASAAPEDQLERVLGRKGLMRFWDCCGDEREDAVGCEAGFHLTFDDDDNARRGWR